MNTAQTIVMVGLTLIAVAGMAWLLVHSWEQERQNSILAISNRSLALTNASLTRQLAAAEARELDAYVWYARWRLGGVIIDTEDATVSTKEN